MRLREFFCGILLAGLVSCSVAPLKPGFGVSAPGVVFQQSQNPATSSKQTYKKTTVTEPALSLPKEPVVNARDISVTPVKTTTTEEVNTEIGSAQKDTARELGAKLGALKGVVWVGVLLFVFGAASAFYPPLKLIVGSVTTSAVIAASGLALIVLPSLIVGNEILILCIGVGVAGVYFFAHRHGSVHAELKTLKK